MNANAAVLTNSVSPAVADTLQSVAAQRTAAVHAAQHAIRTIVGDRLEPSAVQLAAVAQVLVPLAARVDLFPDAHFPAPVAGEAETLYLLGEDADQRNALYVWRPAPGLATAVHDHSTWVVVVGVEGEEPNTFWRGTDDGTIPGHCSLEAAGARRVGPGQWCTLGPRDIHSVTIDGPHAIKHLHLYGRSLMDLPERVDFDPTTGHWHVLTGKPVVLAPGTGALAGE